MQHKTLTACRCARIRGRPSSAVCSSDSVSAEHTNCFHEYDEHAHSSGTSDFLSQHQKYIDAPCSSSNSSNERSVEHSGAVQPLLDEDSFVKIPWRCRVYQVFVSRGDHGRSPTLALICGIILKPWASGCTKIFKFS